MIKRNFIYDFSSSAPLLKNCAKSTVPLQAAVSPLEDVLKKTKKAGG
jgi:hypothetical protein